MDVGPLQRDQLTDPHAGGRGELVRGGQAILNDPGQEGAELYLRVVARYDIKPLNAAGIYIITTA